MAGRFSLCGQEFRSQVRVKSVPLARSEVVASVLLSRTRLTPTDPAAASDRPLISEPVNATSPKSGSAARFPLVFGVSATTSALWLADADDPGCVPSSVQPWVVSLRYSSYPDAPR